MNTFNLSEVGRSHILGILENYPYVSVINYVKLLESETLMEEDANKILNYMGTLPLKVVADFFNKANQYFQQVNTDETAEVAVTPQTEIPIESQMTGEMSK